MLDKVKQLLEYYDQGLIPTLAQHEVHPDVPLGSRKNYLYLFGPNRRRFAVEFPNFFWHTMANNKHR